jgi:hypothetical protein
MKQFSEWFVPHVSNIDPKDTRSNKLVYSIKLNFAAYGNNQYTKDELRERLVDLII